MSLTLGTKGYGSRFVVRSLTLGRRVTVVVNPRPEGYGSRFVINPRPEGYGSRFVIH